MDLEHPMACNQRIRSGLEDMLVTELEVNLNSSQGNLMISIFGPAQRHPPRFRAYTMVPLREMRRILLAHGHLMMHREHRQQISRAPEYRSS